LAASIGLSRSDGAAGDGVQTSNMSFINVRDATPVVKGNGATSVGVRRRLGHG
jgi:hypothetical protein